MAKTKRSCVMCGTVYEYCSHCGVAPQLWKNVFCSENCRDIYTVLNKYDGKLISKEDGIEQLKKYDVTVASKFNDRFKKLAEELTPKKEPAKKQIKVSDESSKEEKVESVKKTTTSKKRKSRTQTRKPENDLVN